MRKRPDYWRNLERVRDDMELEAVGSAQIETVLKMIRASTHLIDEYLAGRLKKPNPADREAGAGGTIKNPQTGS